MIVETVSAGRRGFGCELKSLYFRQAVKNLEKLLANKGQPQAAVRSLFDDIE